MSDEIEAGLQRVLARLKEREDAKNGPGAFDHSVRQGQILLRKRADDLTPEEKAFLQSPPPAKRQA